MKVQYVKLLLLVLLNKGASEKDPCSNHKLLPKAEYRGKQCLLYDVGSATCDRGLDSGWYAVKQNNKYVEMPTSCPPPFSCDTAAPIWLNGSNPNSTEGIVERQLCVRGIYDDECCKSTVSAKMKNCGAFYVYYLAYTDTCDYAYCFGNDKCPATAYTNYTMTPSTVLSPSDPCRSAVPLYKAGLRGTYCPVYDVGKPICDRLLSVGWYSVKVNGKNVDMPNACINAGTCGTSASIWLDGNEKCIFPKVEVSDNSSKMTGIYAGIGVVIFLLVLIILLLTIKFWNRCNGRGLKVENEKIGQRNFTASPPPPYKE
ncbi:unnamed protein product [Mytilus coruscus]|uniref:UMOD/GP2/OIT3-like D8C domain-containing protein n=1 Tax=Mytilus coruscus TaxID=42192 RepID=A0A6J8AJN4_MYTCO|nr:unnamed protein product [Mytilus coruscus]